jgi:serine/threonine-protein kinase
MWKEANRAGTHALALDPHDFGGMISVLVSCLNGTGDIKEARRIMTTFPPETRLTSKVSGDIVAVISQRAYLSVIERDFQTALKIWEQGDPAEKRERGLAAEPAIHVLAGDTASAMAEIEEARDLLEARLRERPNDIDTITQLSWVYVALKRNTDALNLARQATRLLPLEKDAYLGTGILANLAEVEAQTGETAEAVKTLRRLLSIPAGVCVSIARLKIDPVWDPIRNDPGFQQLLAGQGQIEPNK